MKQEETVSLREFLESRIEGLKELLANSDRAQKEAINIAFEAAKELVEAKAAAQERSMVVAKVEMDKRLEHMNEIRKQLDQQAGTFMTKDAAEGKFASLQVTINMLEKGQAVVESKASQRQLTAVMLLALASLAVAIISAFLKVWG